MFIRMLKRLIGVQIKNDYVLLDQVKIVLEEYCLLIQEQMQVKLQG
jgi:hypothetical protein